MANSYFPTLAGPNINESLFIDARTKGIANGQALPSTVSSIIQGGIKGAQLGLSVATGIQNLQTAEQQQEVTQMQIDEAKKQQEFEQTNAQVINDQKQIELQTKTNQLKVQKEQSSIKLNDVTNVAKILDLLGSGDPATSSSVLTDPAYQGTLMRDPQFANQVIGSLEAQGADPELIRGARASANANLYKNQQSGRIASENGAISNITTKQQENYATALSAMSANLPGFNQQRQSTDYNPAQLRMYNKADVQYNGDTLQTDPSGKSVLLNSVPVSTQRGHVLAYGNKIIDDNISDDDASEYKKLLNDYKIGAVNQFGAITGSANTGDVNAQKGPVQTTIDTSNGFGLQATPNGQPITSTANANYNIISAAKARNAQMAEAAQKSGQTSYAQMLAQGRNFATKNTSQSVPTYLQSNQSTPPVTGAYRISKPVPPPSNPTSLDDGIAHVSAVLGGAPVYSSFNIDRVAATPEVITRINGIPELENKPAIFKGLIAVESAGNPNAKSSAGAVGLTQLMKGAATDVGLTSEERLDPSKNIIGGAKYLEQTYLSIEKSLKTAIGNQSIPQKVDPRFVLAAYNGGADAIKKGINAGNTTWPEMLNYLKSNKSTEAFAENSVYADKVIAASLPFIKGGNASDDDYLQTLVNFNIIGVDNNGR